MKSIDDYISETVKMQNVSDGGSPAYSFDDVVLVKYSIPTEYGIARENEELIAKEVNKKNAKGINTPAHLAIKRVNDGNQNICWVLQEKAKGESFTKYASANNDSRTQLVLQQILLDAPDYHYEKCITDLSELFNMGLELKPKNIFYDKSKENDGFSFIDLLGYNPTPVNLNSISDILWLDKYARFISDFTQISNYDKEATVDQIKKSMQMFYKIRQRIFIAMEKVIPNFNQFRRWVLRSYSKDVLDFFRNNGVFVGDLSLTEQEYKQFNSYIEIIVNKCIEKISTGENMFWQIEMNEIRNMLDAMGMQDAWKFHKANPITNPEDYDDTWDFEYARKKSLESLVNKIFNERLTEIAENTNNLNILKAKSDLDKKYMVDQSRKIR